MQSRFTVPITSRSRQMMSQHAVPPAVPGMLDAWPVPYSVRSQRLTVETEDADRDVQQVLCGTEDRTERPAQRVQETTGKRGQ